MGDVRMPNGAATDYQFRIIATGGFAGPPSDDDLLDVTDRLGAAGCTDCSVGAHANGFELEFDRAHRSLQEAIVSAVQDVERAGFHVTSIQIDRDRLAPIG